MSQRFHFLINFQTVQYKIMENKQKTVLAYTSHQNKKKLHMCHF